MRHGEKNVHNETDLGCAYCRQKSSPHSHDDLVYVASCTESIRALM
jgi:hypothetical protein